ncbi:hypothetical protein TWF506_009786 [Arthrobotrys conoides]|uniref:NACHT domain-containing protein n=1 Tax=Arthrobotrys conoides TaxID=74498 RepID=A0AAN8NC34_9PEZI
MDGLSAAANIIAVVQAATEVGKLCVQYAREVKNASKDIERVKAEVDAISTLLLHTQRLLDGPYRNKLSASTDLDYSLTDCKNQLDYLLRKFEVEFTHPLGGKSRRRDKLLRHFKISSHDLKWPFTKTEVEDIIKRLRTVQELIDRALQIDQINVVLSVEQKANLEKLPIASGAIFNSFEDDGEPECLPGTRTGLLRDLHTWIADPKETRIFWLCGMAGTGKSTISRTLARMLSENGQLGASFFFKRGKAHRGDASRFFSTLAIDLQAIIPLLGPYISETVGGNPNICQKTLSEQFQKLLLDPLNKIRRTDVPDPSKALVLVIDALDECEGDGIVQRIIEFLGQLAGVDLNMRIFVTSRPEAPIKAGFDELKRDHKDISLHNIQEPTIKDDISLFIRYQLDNIRKTRKLDSSWPGDGTIVTLTDMTMPLFISAATLCRFIGDQRFSVHQRLENVLKLRNASFASKLDQTYRPIFDQILADTDKTEEDELIQGFQEIIGTIILLESPFGLSSLSIFLNIEAEQLCCRLHQFQSVIKIPDDLCTPLQIYHLSFRDYLLDRNIIGDWFQIDASRLHWFIGTKCIQVLSKVLKPDICNLINPGTEVQDIDSTTRSRHFTPEVAYSCQYWAHHIAHSTDEFGLNKDKSEILLKFLEHHLLHWLEAMIILRSLDKAMEAVSIIKSLNPKLSALLRDTIFFINLHSSTIVDAPLQLYSSALLFTPDGSIVKQLFIKSLPAWIPRAPSWHRNWGYCVRDVCWIRNELEEAFVISPDGIFLALTNRRRPCIVEVLNAITGSVSQSIPIEEELECDASTSILSVHFTEDNKYLAIVVDIGHVMLWDLLAGKLFKITRLDVDSNAGCNLGLENPFLKKIEQPSSSEPANYSTLSPDCMLLAFGNSQGIVTMWARSTLESEFQLSYLQAFNVDPVWAFRNNWEFLSMEFGTITHTLVAVLHNRWTITTDEDKAKTLTISVVWDTKSGQIVKSYHYYDEEAPYACAFSIDCKVLAVALPGSKVEIWDSASHSTLQQLKESPEDKPKARIDSLKFSFDGGYLAIGYREERIRVIDLKNGVCVERFKEKDGKCRPIGRMEFSKDGYHLFFIKGHQLQAWCIDFTGLQASSNDGNLLIHQFKDQRSSRLVSLTSRGFESIEILSPDKKHLAVSQSPGKLKLWNIASNQPQIILNDDSITGVKAAGDLAFSSDSRWLVANRTTGDLILWETNDANLAPKSLDLLNILEEHRHEAGGGMPRSLCFSVDNNQIFYITGNATVDAWNLNTDGRKGIYQGERDPSFEIQVLKPAPDGLHLALLILEPLSVELLHISTGVITKTFNLGHIGLDEAPLQLFGGWGKDHTTPRTLTFSADGRLLAMAALKPIVILDIEVPKATSIFTNGIVNSISFSTVGYSLIINGGITSIDIEVSEPFGMSQVSSDLIEDKWISFNRSAVLRLPSELRRQKSFIGLAGSVFVFLREDGDPFFLEIDDKVVKRLLIEHAAQR